MKKLTFLVVAAMGANTLFAQTANQTQTGSTLHSLYKLFLKTIPLRDMPLQTDEDRAAANAHP